MIAVSWCVNGCCMMKLMIILIWGMWLVVNLIIDPSNTIRSKIIPEVMDVYKQHFDRKITTKCRRLFFSNFGRILFL
ncbi:unnamed protein product [Linum tenue]|uniref:Uncharacterized protein n=1 Tax=Linum tenue TaxID=586396 RepID=A0AAV0MJ33_9ROSI|nr:unnamed protein product [Linum tenue]